MPAAEEIQIPKDTPAPEGDQTPEQKTPEQSQPAPVAPITEVVVKEKSRAGLITVIIILAFLLGGVVALLIMQFTGTIELQNLFSGGGFSSIFTGGKSETGKNSYGGTGYGMHGGSTNDSSTPTSATAKSVCESAGNVWETADITDVASGDADFETVLSEAYTCMLSEGATVTEDSFAFRIAFTTTHFTNVDYYQRMIDINTKEFNENNGGILENSTNFFKGYKSSTSSNGMDQFNFMALYKNAVIELLATTTDTANRVLSQLGFPDRSYGIIPQNSSSSNQSENVKQKRNLTPKEISELEYYNNQYAASGLIDYLIDHNDTYPDISGLEGVIIDGTGSTVLDDFYNNYIVNGGYIRADEGYTDANGDPVKIRFYSSAQPSAVSEPIVTIHLETSCYGDNFELQANPGHIVATYPTSDGGYLCDSRGRGGYHF